MADLFASEPSARDLAKQGINAAIEHADHAEDGWSERAYSLFIDFAARHAEFMTEDVRRWATDEGLNGAPSARAWGAVALRACREGIIAKAGYRRTQNPSAHGTPATLWRSAIYQAAA